MTPVWRNESLYGTDQLNKDTELAKRKCREQITFIGTNYLLKIPLQVCGNTEEIPTVTQQCAFTQYL